MTTQSTSDTAGGTNPLALAGGFVVDLVVTTVKILFLLVGIIIGLAVLAIPLVVLGPVVLLVFVFTLPFGGLYRHTLARRYLKRKLAPLFAGAAVALCTMMVIVVISIMGGFLELVRNSGHRQIGEVSVYAGLGGFAHYEKLIKEIEKLPQAEAATALIHAYGLLKLPGDVIKGVQVHGIDGEGVARVCEYRQTLYWTRAQLEKHGFTQTIYAQKDPVEAALKMAPPWPRAVEAGQGAMVTGIEVSPYNHRNSDGSYRFSPSVLGRALTLTVLPVSGSGGALTPSTDQFVVVNEFKSGLFEVDRQRIYIPFAAAQKMMLMDAAQKVDPDDPTKVIGTVPARCTEIQVAAAEGVTSDALAQAVRTLYDRVRQDHRDLPHPAQVRIATWQQMQATLINAVENEKGLLTVLFGIISVVAVVLIGVLFYMIVLEKTRDIGILRAVGASRVGVASIFIGFGAAIGIIGAALGTLIAYLIVTYINEIHTWLGDTFGLVIWDRSVYFFDRIPSSINWFEVGIIVTVAVGASLVGAMIPAFRAGLVDPVRSLRYE